MESVKIVAIDAANMEAFIKKKGWDGTTGGRFIAPWNGLDVTSTDYIVPLFIEETINELESQGWYFVKLIHHDGCMMFRNSSDLRNIARELAAERKL